MIGVRKHVDGLDAANTITALQEIRQLPRKGLWVARDVHDARRPDALEQHRPHARGAAVAGRIENGGVPAFSAEPRGGILDARGDRANASRRDSIQTQVRFQVVDRPAVFLDCGHRRSAAGDRQGEQPAPAVEIEHAFRAFDGANHELHQLSRGSDISLEERVGRDQKIEAGHAVLPDAASSFDMNGLVADHVRSRPRVDIDQEAVGSRRRLEKSAYRRAQRSIVAGHDQHTDRFRIIVGRSNDEVPQDAAETIGRVDAAAGQLIAELERDPVRPGTVHRTFFDRHDPLRAGGEVAHHESSRAGAEHERRFLSKGGLPRRRDQRRDVDAGGTEQLREARPFAAQLLVAGHAGQGAAAARPEVPAPHGRRRPISRTGPRARSAARRRTCE